MRRKRSGVVVTCAGTWHAPHMCHQLQRLGMLRYVLTTMPPSRYMRRASIRRSAVRWVPFPELIGPRIASRFRRAGSPALAELHRAVAFDRMACGILCLAPPEMVVSFTTFGLTTLGAMRRLGVPTVTECGSCHVDFRVAMRREEYAAMGLRAEDRSIEERTRDREVAEYEAAEFIAVPSDLAVQSFIEHGLPPAKLLKIPYGVDTDLFHPSLSRPDQVFRVITVGDLGWRKGTRHLIGALEQLRGREIELIVVGSLSPWMRRRLESSGGFTWTFLGRLSPSGLAAEYRRASVLCLPSLEEGMSLSVLEAMASGLPVIVSTNTGYSTVVDDGREGFTVPIRDSDAIATRIAQLQDDSDLRSDIAVRARARAEEYSWVRYGDRLERAYRQVIAGRE